MTTITKTAVAIALVAATSSALAWGPREQGALAGLVIGGIVGSQIEQNERQYEPRHHRHQQAPVYVQPQPVYIQPQPQICGYNILCSTYNRQPPCADEAIYDQFGRFVSYQRICR